MRKILLFSILLMTISLSLINLAHSKNYQLCTYGDEDSAGARNALLKTIDLQTAIITDSVIISTCGYVPSKKPAIISLNGQRYLIAFSEDGGYNKNVCKRDYTVYYVIVKDSTTLSVMHRDSVFDAAISQFKQYRGDSTFQYGLIRYQDTSYTNLIPSGRFTLDNDFNFYRQNSMAPNSIPGRITLLGSFECLDRVNLPNNHNLYYSLDLNSNYWILRLSSAGLLIDSLLVENISHASTIFAYHPGRDKIYCFYLNYEQHGKFKEYEKNYKQDWITPQVKIYDPGTLKLSDSIQIADFDSGNYPLGERGLADVVGDYIVYYFFEDEWIGSINPAVLFIFDTRTNEARWLRVGWR
jgi:hypothetical protein